MTLTKLHDSASARCPAVWTTISSDLYRSFRAGPQCTDLARGAIRFAFHDAATFSASLPFYAPAAGGADGSLLLSPDEIYRDENAGLLPTYQFLKSKYSQYSSEGVSAADFVQFAGALGVVSCPLGVISRIVVGRQDSDSSVAAPKDLLPAASGPNASQSVILSLFQDKGFSARDLAALVGAHTSSRAFNETGQGIPSGGAQDSTPGVWDVKYYAQTYRAPKGVYRFESDINLSKIGTPVGNQFASFVGNQLGWTIAFASAFAKLQVLGIPAAIVKDLVDCTAALRRKVPPV